jgi:protein CpxP
MKKETLLTTAVIALLLLNFGTLGFLFFHRPPHPPGAEQPGRRIVQHLQLDAAQQQKFEQLKSAHHEQMRTADRAYRDALEQYFALLKNDTVDIARRDSLQAVLTRIQQERASVTFQHFADLKALCTPQQRTRFDALLPDLMQVILPPRRDNRPPRPN